MARTHIVSWRKVSRIRIHKVLTEYFNGREIPHCTYVQQSRAFLIFRMQPARARDAVARLGALPFANGKLQLSICVDDVRKCTERYPAGLSLPRVSPVKPFRFPLHRVQPAPLPPSSARRDRFIILTHAEKRTQCGASERATSCEISLKLLTKGSTTEFTTAARLFKKFIQTAEGLT